MARDLAGICRCPVSEPSTDPASRCTILVPASSASSYHPRLLSCRGLSALEPWALIPTDMQFIAFFIADELNSLVYSIQNIYFLSCGYAHRWPGDIFEVCPAGKTWQYALLLCLPALARLIQCVKRWHDTRLRIHLINVCPISGKKLMHRPGNTSVQSLNSACLSSGDLEVVHTSTPLSLSGSQSHLSLRPIHPHGTSSSIGVCSDLVIKVSDPIWGIETRLGIIAPWSIMSSSGSFGSGISPTLVGISEFEVSSLLWQRCYDDGSGISVRHHISMSVYG